MRRVALVANTKSAARGEPMELGKRAAGYPLVCCLPVAFAAVSGYTLQGTSRGGVARTGLARNRRRCYKITPLFERDLCERVCTSGIPERHLAGVWSGAFA